MMRSVILCLVSSKDEMWVFGYSFGNCNRYTCEFYLWSNSYFWTIVYVTWHLHNCIYMPKTLKRQPDERKRTDKWLCKPRWVSGFPNYVGFRVSRRVRVFLPSLIAFPFPITEFEPSTPLNICGNGCHSYINFY